MRFVTYTRPPSGGNATPVGDLYAPCTPSLIELYRTAPYLHDGRAATIEDVITKYNPNDNHGETRDLSKQELADLVTFLKSL